MRDATGYRPRTNGLSTEGSNGVTTGQREERRRKEQELIDKATKLAIELYGPALKELAQH